MIAARGFAADKLTLRIGHTGLTWIPLGAAPGGPPPINPMVDPLYVEAAIRDIAALGFYGIELFGNQIEAMEAKGGVGEVLKKNNLPLISAYCGTNLSDPAQRKDSIAKTLEWATLVKKYGGKVIVVGPNGVRRNKFDFKAHKDDILTTLNELGKAVTDLGLTAVLHQHTGTCVETRDETYAVMEGVDSRDEVRSGHRPVAERRIGSRPSSERLSPAGAAHAYEGLFRREGLPRILSARSGQSGHSSDPIDDGGPQDSRLGDGRIGFPAAPAHTRGGNCAHC
jgi:hypothetical protein